MSQTLLCDLRPSMSAKTRETIAWLREEATRQFINGNVRGSSYRHALAGDLERGYRERSTDYED
jgi:hypothetical protein